MQQRTLTIVNRLGLHARAAAKMVKLAAGYKSAIIVARNDSQEKRTDAKSIFGLLMLAASRGTVIDITTEGADEAEAMDAVCTLVENRFGEE